MLITNIYIAAFCFLLAAGFCFRKNHESSTSVVTDVCFCAATALAASTFFSLFPLTKTYTYTDSSVFLYIGKMMQQGLVPYRDLFDHKGILLYLIQYAGLQICPDGFFGVWILEVVHMFATVWFLFKLSGLFTEDKMIRYLSVIAVAVMCGMNTYEGGNFTEEYALPWIAAALYIFLKYFKTNSYRFVEIVFLGVGAAVISLLRVNMVTVWIALMPLVIIQMLFRKEFRDLFSCVGAFCAGVFAVYLPMLCYLLITGCFQDFIDCYLVFNFAYSDGGIDVSDIFHALTEGVKNLSWAFAAGLIAVIPYRKKKLFWLNVWSLLVTLYFSHMSGRFYQHYGMILLPMLVPFMTGAIEVIYGVLSWGEKFQFHLKFPKNWIMTGGFFAAAFAAFFLQYKWANLIRETMMETGGVRQLTECLLEKTSPEDDVLIVGNDAKYYLLADRTTKNKYFYQTPPIKISDALYEDFMKEVEEKPSDCIVIFGNKEKCLEREDHLGQVYRYFEDGFQKGEYQCEIYENFYTYLRNED